MSVNAVAKSFENPTDHISEATHDAVYSRLLFGVRAALANEAAAQGVSKADLARRLGVSRSRVTRVMDPSQDILASSLADLAWALGCEWEVLLKRVSASSSDEHRSNRPAVERAGWSHLANLSKGKPLQADGAWQKMNALVGQE